MSQPLYLIMRNGPTDADIAHEGVVKTLRDGRTHIDVAKELWSLAGDDARASAIADVVSRAFRREDPVLFAEDIEQMLALLDGDRLEQALKRTITDDKMFIRPERMSEVRQRAHFINIHESRGDAAHYAVMEGLGRLSELESILKEARDRELDVALD